jgi:hypothetical protein
MPPQIDLHDLHLNFNPEEPQDRFKAAGLEDLFQVRRIHHSRQRHRGVGGH